jgi:ferrous iron transport protein B
MKMAGHDCETCPSGARLAQMGINLARFDHLVALAGNPNTGKSSIFNALTGLKQHVGNWPGKTVTRAEGGFSYSGVNYKLVDLPGTYSLLSASHDEEISRNFILFGRPDCTVVVMDATALERNLNLALQVLEITDKVVLCINLMDEALRKGLEVGVRSLSRDLGVPAVGTSARNREGLHDLVSTIAGIVSGEIRTKPLRPRTSPEMERALNDLVPMIEELVPGLPNARWVAYRLLDGDHRVRQALVSGELAELVARQAGPVEKSSNLIALQGAQ